MCPHSSFRIICLYGGLKFVDEEARMARMESCDFNTTLSQEARDRCLKYRKNLFNIYDFVDIPEEVDSDDFYRATVGHKVSLVIRSRLSHSYNTSNVGELI